MIKRRAWIWLLLGILLSSHLHATPPLFRVQIPDPLKPWIDWVLYDDKDRECTYRFNESENRICAWPSLLTMNLFTNEGKFLQVWEVLTETWVPIPGDGERWPEDVSVDGRDALVAQRQGRPMVKVTAGTRRVAGKFRWGQVPRSLTIPPESGLVRLMLYDKVIPFPDLEQSGKLWLHTGRASEPAENDRLDVHVQRRVVDEIPMQLITRIQLNVSGTQREVSLRGAFTAETIPLYLRSALPASLETDGSLRVQIRPGTWVLELAGRYPGPIRKLVRPAAAAPWPAEEVWVFDARNHLRIVKITGVQAIDPRQTSLPEEWRGLPAYRLVPSSTMELEVVRRGDPQPEPDQLALERVLWLDFDGAGYSIQDTISGTKTAGWRLEMNPPIALGRVTVDGRSQFITRLANSVDQERARDGVELRRGQVDLVADSRMTGEIEHIPTVGWNHDFKQVRATLNLPPGWQLIHAEGVDRVADTWLQRWTLLDLFIVLITAIATGRLWGWYWGVLAVLALGLSWHEPDAPRYVWLALLAGVALLRVLPPGKLHNVTRWYRNGALLVMLVITATFLAQQVRTGLFPQLQRSWQSMVPTTEPYRAADEAAGTAAMIEQDRETAPRKRALSLKSLPTVPEAAPSPIRLERYDPNLSIQTGTGRPAWSWTAISMRWSGPVDASEQIALTLTPPTVNAALNAARILLLLGLALVMLEPRRRRTAATPASTTGLLIAVLVLPLLDGASKPASAADFPPAELLDELENRLAPLPECLPACAQGAKLTLKIEPHELQGRFEVHTLEAVAVPLPGNSRHWLPNQVRISGRALNRLARTTDGNLWVGLASAGRHEIEFSGPLPAANRVQIPLPLRPHRVDYSGRGWDVAGVHNDGVSDGQIELTRIREDRSDRRGAALRPATLPPFARVERTLRLDIDWTVDTVVTRLSPPDNALVLRLPLLTGESITSDGVRTETGKVLINMAPEQRRLSWRSVLRQAPTLTLKAPLTSQWSEVWRVDVSPIWHLESTGIPVVHHQNRTGRWLPEWRPWSGETVKLSVIRPEGVPGPTLSIEGSQLQFELGKRSTAAALSVDLLSGRGSQHTVVLPEGAEVQSVAIDGTQQPIRPDGEALTLPVRPGTQRFEVRWLQSLPMTEHFVAPAVDLGLEGVNSQVRVAVPADRWVLATGGPQLGPAVLFWGALLVVIIAAAALSRTGLTPLRFRHWFLLGIGLTQIPILQAAVVAGWLLALGGRSRLPQDTGKGPFNLTQIGLCLLTAVALATLLHAVQQGLLGTPEMQIAGNGSTAYQLNWYQDRSAAELAQPWVFSVPVLAYRLLMLAWALWLALSLINWLRWGWQSFSTHGIWRPFRIWGGKGRERPSQPSPETVQPS